MFQGSDLLARHADRLREQAQADKSISHTSENTTVALMDAAARIGNDVQRMHAVRSDFEDAQRLRQAVEEYGLSKALLAILPNNIHETLPGIPAMESLNRMPLPQHDPRTENMISSIDAAMESEIPFLKMWISETSKNICDCLDLLYSKSEEYMEQAKRLKVYLKGMYVSDDNLKNATAVCLPSDVQFYVIESMCEVASHFDVPMYNATEGAIQESREALQRLMDRVTPMTGICFNSAGRVTVDGNKVTRKYTPASETLYSKGYTVEKAIEACDMVITLCGALVALTDKKPAIKARLDAIHDSLASAPCAADTDDMSSDDTPAEAPEPVPHEDETPAPEPTYGDDGEEALESADASAHVHRDVLCSWVGMLGVLTESSVKIMASTMMVAEKVNSLK